MFPAINSRMFDKRTISDPPSLVNRHHTCQYCQVKKNVLRAKPGLKFRPTTLKQQILLDIGDGTYGQVDGKFPLPPSLIEEIKGIHEELDRWRFEIWNLRAMLAVSDIIHGPKQIYCFYDRVHWTEHMKIDRPATARMILEALRSYVDLDKVNTFLLAVVHCEEDHIRRVWSEEVIASIERFRPKNPILSYWILKLRNNQNQDSLAKVLTSMNDYGSLHPISDGAWLNALKFMWSEIVQAQNGNMQLWFWKAMLSAIEGKCFQVFSFVWNQLPIEEPFQMVSSDDYLLWKKAVENGHCGILAQILGSIDQGIALEKSVEPFYLAVKGGHRLIVERLWNFMNDRLRNTVLKQHPDIFSVAIEAKCFLIFWNAKDSAHRTWILDNHPKAFCTAAELGLMDLVTIMWEHATELRQRFMLVFDDSCAAFRKSCANGHVDIVRLMWKVMWTDVER